MGVLAVAAIIAAEAVFVAVVALEEDIVAAVEATMGATTSSRKVDEVVREDSIAAAAE